MYLKVIFYSILLSATSLFAQENIEVLGVLPNEVLETSGLIFHNGKLITHNDSGNEAQLFEIDTASYQLTRTIRVTNVQNIDWEDIAQDEEYIYIGDFGNNVGTRTNLSIHRIAKEAYDRSETVTAEQINFSYEDQTDFTNTGNSDWDAEAFFVLENQLIILTKQWQSEGTVAYTIPKTPGNYMASRIDSYAIEGLVTGATYNILSDVLFLVGYSKTLGPFVTRIDGATTTSVFGGLVKRTNLDIGLAQVEAIAYADNNSYYISSEFFSRTSPFNVRLESTLFKFDLDDGLAPEPQPEEPAPEEGEPEQEPKDEEELELEKDEIVLYKKRLDHILEYRSGIESPIIKRSIFDPLGREIQHISGDEIESNRIDLSILQNGIYYLTFYYTGGKKSIPFYKD